jgi:putative phosphotransacetylase
MNISKVEDFKMKVLVETSARHVHLSQEHLEVLFGKGHELTVKKMLSQPGQFACEEKVEVIGTKGSLKMSVLGPVRNDTQVEVSLTDARSIGVVAPIRESGDIKDSGACKIVGPAGEVELTEGVIAAKRHVHMTPEDAEKAGVADKQIVELAIESPNGRSLTFGDVVVRVSASYATAAHIDTDEANALAPGKECFGEMIIK